MSFSTALIGECMIELQEVALLQILSLVVRTGFVLYLINIEDHLVHDPVPV